MNERVQSIPIDFKDCLDCKRVYDQDSVIFYAIQTLASHICNPELRKHEEDGTLSINNKKKPIVTTKQARQEEEEDGGAVKKKQMGTKKRKVSVEEKEEGWDHERETLRTSLLALLDMDYRKSDLIRHTWKMVLAEIMLHFLLYGFASIVIELKNGFFQPRVLDPTTLNVKIQYRSTHDEPVFTYSSIRTDTGLLGENRKTSFIPGEDENEHILQDVITLFYSTCRPSIAGKIRSPVSRLVKEFDELQKLRALSMRGVERELNPMLAIERLPDKTDGLSSFSADYSASLGFGIDPASDNYTEKVQRVSNGISQKTIAAMDRELMENGGTREAMMPVVRDQPLFKVPNGFHMVKMSNDVQAPEVAKLSECVTRYENLVQFTFGVPLLTSLGTGRTVEGSKSKEAVFEMQMRSIRDDLTVAAQVLVTKIIQYSKDHILRRSIKAVVAEGGIHSTFNPEFEGKVVSDVINEDNDVYQKERIRLYQEKWPEESTFVYLYPNIERPLLLDLHEKNILKYEAVERHTIRALGLSSVDFCDEAPMTECDLKQEELELKKKGMKLEAKQAETNQDLQKQQFDLNKSVVRSQQKQQQQQQQQQNTKKTPNKPAGGQNGKDKTKTPSKTKKRKMI